LTLVLPLARVEAVKRRAASLSFLPAGAVLTVRSDLPHGPDTTSRDYFFLMSSRDAFLSTLDARKTHVDIWSSPSASSAAALASPTPGPVHDMSMLSDDPEVYRAEDEMRGREWDRYFASHGFGPCMEMIDDPLSALVLQGIPDARRADLWLLFCGARASLDLHPTYYNDLLTRHASDTSHSVEEIERDVRRSLPNHPHYANEGPGVDPLRRVLVAYSWHNPKLGYCQSMNIVAAALLLFMREDQVFWMLVQLCERLAPDYYSKVLIGSIIDQRILSRLIELHLPKLAERLLRINVPVQLLTLPWFMCLFITYLPWRESLLTLDAFFYEGPVALFKVALAVLKLNSDAIMACDNPEDISNAVRAKRYQGNQLLDVAQLTFSSITPGMIAGMRSGHKSHQVEEMEQSLATSRLRAVQLRREGPVRFAAPVLRALYDGFAAQVAQDPPVSSDGDDDFRISFESFQRLLSKETPTFWLNATTELPELFARLAGATGSDSAGGEDAEDVDNDGERVAWPQYVALIHAIRGAATLEERLRFFLATVEAHARPTPVPYATLARALRWLWHCGPTNDGDDDAISPFLEMVKERCGDTKVVTDEQVGSVVAHLLAGMIVIEVPEES
jgi:hypothetical protein